MIGTLWGKTGLQISYLQVCLWSTTFTRRANTTLAVLMFYQTESESEVHFPPQNLNENFNFLFFMKGKFKQQCKHKTLPKAQRTRGLSSYHKFKHKSWNFIFRISTKHQLQNLNQTSADQPLHKTWSNLASESGPRFNFKTSTKSKSAEKNWPNSSFKSCLNFNFKILTKPCALNKS